MEDKLIYVLFYFKCYPTFDLAGLLFDLNRSQAKRWLHRLQPILESALGKKMALPKRKLCSLEEFLDSFPELKRVILFRWNRASDSTLKGQGEVEGGLFGKKEVAHPKPSGSNGPR